MTSQEVLSMIASIASLVLAILAIWLSIVFYKMATASSERTTDAARGIAANVDRLEKLFDRLYADTFGIMKDTVSDMRRHICPGQHQAAEVRVEAERLADQRISEIRRELVDEVKTLVERQAGSDKRLLNNLTQDFSAVVERAIQQSRNVDVQARKQTLRDKVLTRLREVLERKTSVTAGDFVVDPVISPLGGLAVIEELERMKAEGLIDYPEQFILRTSVLKISSPRGGA